MAEKASGWDQTRPVGNGLEPSPQRSSTMVEPACHTVFCTSAGLAECSSQQSPVQMTETR